ncbi:MAG: hypothetical protein E6R03_14440 [Hyphomicrobiaceae bacterium]|nr:MAG: hypothetical protein E6R03_14440 [Hyphomicrobiaceae bacterium]
MNIPVEAVAAALRSLLHDDLPWHTETDMMRGRYSRTPFVFKRHSRQVDVKAVVMRLVHGWERVFISLSIDFEKADEDEREIPGELVQTVVNILAGLLQPRPVNFMVLSLSGDSTREIWWE